MSWNRLTMEDKRKIQKASKQFLSSSINLEIGVEGAKYREVCEAVGELLGDQDWGGEERMEDIFEDLHNYFWHVVEEIKQQILKSEYLQF